MKRRRDTQSGAGNAKKARDPRHVHEVVARFRSRMPDNDVVTGQDVPP